MEFKAGKHPGNQSDWKFPARTDVPRPILGRAELSRMGPQLQEKGLREHGEEGPVSSAHQDARVGLTGAGP